MYPQCTLADLPTDYIERLWQRFWAKVSPSLTSECWIWTGTGQPRYGIVRVNGRAHLTHRVAWELVHGPIPPGLLVLHHCDVPPCVRPEHLYIGTYRENALDMWRRQRHRAYRGGLPPGAAPGERNGHAKLRDADILEIRRLAAAGRMTQDAIGRQFGIGQGHVSLIVGRKLWPHL